VAASHEIYLKNSYSPDRWLMFLHEIDIFLFKKIIFKHY